MYYLFTQINKSKWGNPSNEFVIRKTKPKGVPYVANMSKEKLEDIREELSEKYFDEYEKIEKKFDDEYEVFDKQLRAFQRQIDKKFEEIELAKAQSIGEFRNNLIDKLYEENPAIVI